MSNSEDNVNIFEPDRTNFIPLDKIKGSLAGGFLGDALGAPHEFKYNSNLPYTGELIHKTRYHNRFNKTDRYMPPGQYTDDSEMTIALIYSMIDNKKYDPKATVLSYIEWANSDTYMMGNNTRALFRGITAKDPDRRINTYTNKYMKLFDCNVSWTTNNTSYCNSEKAKNKQSNGSLMRCSPLALFSTNNAAWVDCQLTNPNLVNIDSSFVYLDAIRLAYYGCSKEDIISTIRDSDRIQTNEVRDVVDSIIEGKDRNLCAVGKGWVLHALYASLTALFGFENFTDAMKWIMSKKGDTDTNASIAGNLFGAYYGFDKLMEDPITKNNWNIIMNVNTTDGDNPRPEKYSPTNFDYLTSKLHEIYVAKE